MNVSAVSQLRQLHADLQRSEYRIEDGPRLKCAKDYDRESQRWPHLPEIHRCGLYASQRAVRLFLTMARIKRDRQKHQVKGEPGTTPLGRLAEEEKVNGRKKSLARRGSCAERAAHDSLGAQDSKRDWWD